MNLPTLPTFAVYEVGRVDLKTGDVRVSPLFRFTSLGLTLIYPWGAITEKDEEGNLTVKRYFAVVSLSYPLLTFNVGGGPEDVEEILLGETFWPLLRIMGAPINLMRAKELIRKNRDEIVDGAVKFLSYVAKGEEVPTRVVRMKFPSPPVISYPKGIRGKREGYLVYDGLFDNDIFDTDVKAVVKIPWHVWAEANFRKNAAEHVTVLERNGKKVWSEKPFSVPLEIEKDDGGILYIACFTKDMKLHASDGKKEAEFTVLGTVGFSL